MSELFSSRSGRGRPVLVLHGGLGLDHTYMRALDRVSDLAELIYVDIRGNGRSPRDGVETMTFESICDELDALRAELGFERWNVLGHSFGSFIALVYAMRHSTRVDGLVVVSTAPSFDHVDRRDAPPSPSEDEAFGAQWRAIVPQYFHAWHPRHLGAFADTRYSAAGYRRGATLLETYNVRSELARITAPTLVLSGDDDFVTPADVCAAPVARGITHARLAVIPKTGHFPFLESPVAFDAELRPWLTSVART